MEEIYKLILIFLQKIEELLSVAKLGDDVFFTHNGKMVVHLNIAHSIVKKKSQPGRLIGQSIKLDNHFFEPLDEEVLKLW